MSRRAAVAVLVAGMLAALALSGAALLLADHSWKQVADYRSPYAGPGLPAASGGDARTGRVVFVIIDGLRADAANDMAILSELRQHGADLTLVAPQPSLSYPNWTTLLSGAPQRLSGVTTNDFDRRVPVETLIDTALSAEATMVVVGPTALETLYGAGRAQGTFFRDWKPGEYLSSALVVQAVKLTERVKPRLVVLHFPDLDEAGHHSGGTSAEYAKTAQRIDTDLSVLVNALQDGRTTFVIATDHGHIATGGHGGWEPEVVDVPAVMAGPGVGLGRLRGRLEDVAPTVATLAGIPAPRHSAGRTLSQVLVDPSPLAVAGQHEQRVALVGRMLQIVEGRRPAPAVLSAATDTKLDRLVRTADDARLRRERRARLPLALAVVAGALFLFVAVGALSWRALVAALAGAFAYHLTYNGLFFGVHRLQWSLSVINSEDRMNAFFATRMAEAALAGLVGVALAALVYPLLRREPKAARGPYLTGWLSLGPATVLVVQATLALMVAWYLWAWGPQVTWILPDLRWGFKYDLDLLQTGALGVVALLAPVVTLLVGRYHPSVPRPPRVGDAPDLSVEETQWRSRTSASS